MLLAVAMGGIGATFPPPPQKKIRVTTPLSRVLCALTETGKFSPYEVLRRVGRYNSLKMKLSQHVL